MVQLTIFIIGVIILYFLIRFAILGMGVGFCEIDAANEEILRAVEKLKETEKSKPLTEIEKQSNSSIQNNKSNESKK